MSSLQSGMSRFLIIKTVIYMLIFAVVIGIRLYQKSDNQTENTWLTATWTGSTQTICLANQEERCFDLEIARTPAQREYGLMNRTGMNLDSGMIFVFDHDDIYSFWMKSTLIPLDMLRVSSTGQIVDIQTALPCTDDPCPSYRPIGTARYVVELNAGIAQLMHITTWSMLHLLDK